MLLGSLFVSISIGGRIGRCLVERFFFHRGRRLPAFDLWNQQNWADCAEGSGSNGFGRGGIPGNPLAALTAQMSRSISLLRDLGCSANDQKLFLAAVAPDKMCDLRLRSARPAEMRSRHINRGIESHTEIYGT